MSGHDTRRLTTCLDVSKETLYLRVVVVLPASYAIVVSKRGVTFLFVVRHGALMTTTSRHLANAIEGRRKELDYTPTGLAEATGLSLQALKNIRRGEVRQYQERLTMPLTKALRWTPDSIERLLHGDEPVTWEREADEVAKAMMVVGKAVAKAGDPQSGDVRVYLNFRNKAREWNERLGRSPVTHVEADRLLDLIPLEAPITEPNGQPSPWNQIQGVLDRLDARIEELERQVATLQSAAHEELSDDDAEMPPGLGASDAAAEAD